MKVAETRGSSQGTDGMDYFRRFTFLFSTPSFDADDLEGVQIEAHV